MRDPSSEHAPAAAECYGGLHAVLGVALALPSHYPHPAVILEQADLGCAVVRALATALERTQAGRDDAVA